MYSHNIWIDMAWHLAWCLLMMMMMNNTQMACGIYIKEYLNSNEIEKVEKKVFNYNLFLYKCIILCNMQQVPKRK